MFNLFKKHTTTLTIRDLTDKLLAHLGCDATVAFLYVRKYPNIKVTDLYIRWIISNDEGYVVRFDADYVDELLKDEESANNLASLLAIKFKKMREIGHKVEEGSHNEGDK